MKQGLGKNGPVGALYDVRLDDRRALYRHFAKWASSTIDRPTLLILDNRTKHSILATYNLCKTSVMRLLSITPHTSH